MMSRSGMKKVGWIAFCMFIASGLFSSSAFAQVQAQTPVPTTTTPVQVQNPTAQDTQDDQSQPMTAKQEAQALQIQRLLNNWRARQGIPGTTLSVLLPGHKVPITFTSGTTTLYGDQRVDSNNLFQAGSITKSFTSTIILQLEAEGKLNIDDPITNYLPQYPQWKNVTIRELLNHTSGIFNYTETAAFNNIRKENPEAGFTPEEIVQMAARFPLSFPPGHGWHYSNTNYVLAGMIISAVTHEPVSDVMNHYLHGGMRVSLLNTYYLPTIYSGSIMSRMAHGYSVKGTDVTGSNMSWAGTAGAIVTTTQDLLTWWQAIFQGHLLPDAQLQQMMSLVCEGAKNCYPGRPIPHLWPDQAGRGYGLGIAETSFGSPEIGTVWWHNGSTEGYKALVMWFPKSDIYMALTINRNPGYLLKPELPIVRQVLSVLTSAPPPTIYHPIKRFFKKHPVHHKKHEVHH